MSQRHRQGRIIGPTGTRAENEVTRLQAVEQIVQCDRVQPTFVLRRSPLQDDDVSAGLGHSVSDVEGERIEVIDEQDSAGWRLISKLFQFQNSAAGSTTWCLTWGLKWMNSEGSAWQCRVFPAHPTRCNAKRRPLPSRLFNLFLGLRGGQYSGDMARLTPAYDRPKGH